MKRFLSVFFLALVVLSIVAVPALADPPGGYDYILHPPTNPPAGWVMVGQLLVHSGCTGCDCGAAWRPGNETGLVEKPADRTTVGHDQGDGTPPGAPYAVGHYPRPKCARGEWSAGTWYHNAVFQIVYDGNPICRWTDGGSVRICDYYGAWGGTNWEGWNFAADDSCTGDATPGVPGPAATPTPCPITARGHVHSAMTNFAYAPAYPVVVGQGGSGFYATASFREGKSWYRDCHGTHDQDDPIVFIGLTTSLAPSSIDWIEHDLASRYYGATVQGSYPQQATLYAGAGRATVATRWPGSNFYRALDPGYYELTYTVRLRSGQTDTYQRRVPVHLKDSTVIR